MIETIKQYNENKVNILKQIEDSERYIGNRVMSPNAIAHIIDVPIRKVYVVEELRDLDELNKLTHLEDSFEVGSGTTLDSMFKYGVSKLLFIFYHYRNMNYFFVMDNNKSFRVRHGELMNGKRAKPITERLLLVFEKLKIEELRDRATWISIDTRFEILDL